MWQVNLTPSFWKYSSVIHTTKNWKLVYKNYKGIRPQQIEIPVISLATCSDLIPIDFLSFYGRSFLRKHHYVPVTLAIYVASNWITSAKLNWETCVMNTKFLTSKKLWRYNNELCSKLDWHQNTEILQNLETRRPCVVAHKWSKGTTTGHEGL